MKSATRSFHERNSKKQTRLAFQTLPATAPGKEQYSQAVQDRLSSVRYQGAPARRSPRSTVSADSTLPTPEPSSQPEIQAGSKTLLSSDHSESEDDDDIILPSSKRRRVNIDNASSQTPTRRSGRLAENDGSRTRAKTTMTSPLRDELELLGSPETSGDEDQAMFSRPTQRQRQPSRVQNDDPFIDDHEQEPIKPRRKPASDFVVDDDHVEFLSDDDVPQPTKSKKKRRLTRSRHEQDELDEDLEDLRTSDVEEQLSRTRGRVVNKKRDEAREHLELLRRRRAGEKIPRVADADVDEYDFGDEDGVDLDAITTALQRRLRESPDPYHDSHSQKSDEPELVDEDQQHEEDDFVVEDEDELEHEPSSRRPNNGIPLEFTSYASSKPKDLFIHVVEWLVKNKIAPAFSRDDELYRLAWSKINDQIRAQAGSRLISSAWQSEFKNAILARPGMKINSTDGLSSCDACNKTNHPAHYAFRFSGHAYDPNTLELLKDDDIDDESQEEQDDEDNASYDAAGHHLTPSDTTFLLGRFCAANAEMGHKLTHWKFHLNEALLEYLENQGVLAAEMIVARDKKSKKKREKEAERIVDTMDVTGVIASMWKDLQNNLEDARFGMEDHFSSKGRGKGRIGNVRARRGDGTIEEWTESGQRRIFADDSDDE